jgi:dihydropteroate synthase
MAGTAPAPLPPREEGFCFIEPLAILHGAAARDAMARGLALPLAGGPAAFALARIGPADGPVVPVAEIPATCGPALAEATAPRPVWAGLPGAPPWIMGILNVTPDSFSDGGRHADPARAIAAGLAMHAQGAAIIDIGGESTRPGAAPVTPAEEQARILPVIRALAAQGVPVSADTRHAATMAAALDAGARAVNDVTALAHDPQAAPLAAARGAPVVLMHMRGSPQTMDALATYADIACDVAAELQARVDAAEAAGIPRAALAIDPGFGFAKSHAGNLELLARLPLLHCLGLPLLAGVSRKRMIGTLTGEPDPARRDPGSIAAALRAAEAGAQILRVHDVPATAQALRAWRGLVAA